MTKIAQNLTDLIGKTPLLELCRYNEKLKINAHIIAKLEYFNPGGSVKDRAAFYMIQAAEFAGTLKSFSTIIEPTSGNTGVGLALVCAAKPYSLVLVMPESMSIERRKLLLALGAKLVLTPAAKGMKGAIEKAAELQKETADSLILGQFDNEANIRAHEQTTAQEIWEDTEGDVDVFVSGVGTSGTIMGVSNVLKKKNPQIHIVAVEPDDSPVLSGGNPGPHKIQGVGAGFIPSLCDVAKIDEVITVSTEQAFETARIIARTEGLLVGISSGAALYAATKLAQRSDLKGKRIVVVLPDTGERYLSTDLFSVD